MESGRFGAKSGQRAKGHCHNSADSLEQRRLAQVRGRERSTCESESPGRLSSRLSKGWRWERHPWVQLSVEWACLLRPLEPYQMRGGPKTTNQLRCLRKDEGGVSGGLIQRGWTVEQKGRDGSGP